LNENNEIITCWEKRTTQGGKVNYELQFARGMLAVTPPTSLLWSQDPSFKTIQKIKYFDIRSTTDDSGKSAASMG